MPRMAGSRRLTWPMVLRVLKLCLKSVDLRRRNREEVLGFHLWDQ